MDGIMDGIKDFRKFQLGREVKHGGVAGTAVAATAIWRGQVVGTDDTPTNFPQEGLGYLVDVNRAYSPYVLGSFRQGPDPCTFEQLPYVLAAAIRGIEIGTKDGSGSGYVYHYPWPLTDASVEKTAATISFTATAKTIADSANGLGLLQAGDIIRISGAGETGNNGIFTVATAAAGSITVNETLTDEDAGASVTIEVLTQTYTAEGGNNARVEQSAYSFPTQFELSGRGGANADAVMLSSTWTTRQWKKLAAGFTGNISLPPVTEVLFPGSRLYIDDTDGTIGTTEKPNTLAGFTYRATTGLLHQFAGNGELYYARAQRIGKATQSLTIQLYQNAAGLAEYDAWRARTPRLLQIRIEGPALTKSGTSYSKKSVLLSLPGMWSNFPRLEDIDGAEVLPGTFRPAYDPTAGIGPSITVVNELDELP